ncbi:acyl-CoA dehydrogenase family protein [Ruegeria litorea]|uniref:Acyl-CoA dehydrogenase family protein n=1 Tax=Falsiruegeria litorea TaxID=1280831 RepID=A0ABS5WK39_9RHOB|nr:acyl-CoA dehydrogenase family protein [Falsiruegeria litorea]MBT3139492.1 acyl-CoA dehydrogenase family protein [Falsiruegeria litorea]
MTISMNLVSDPQGDHDTSVKARAQAFAREHVAPYAETWERDGIYPKGAIFEASKEFGGFLIPKELGGKGGSVTEFLIMVEEMAKVDIAFTLAFVVHNNVAYIISQSPNASLRDRLLPALIAGERIGAFCLTEPGAGSDAAGITTRADLVDGDWQIFGTKGWITAGGCADDLVVFAKTTDTPGPKSVACFAVDGNGPDIERSDRYELVSGHLPQVCDITFKGVNVAEKDVLFEPGTAFAAAMGCLDAARLGIAAMCNGALTSALETSIEYAGQRKMFGGCTLDNQGIQWTFSEHLTQLEASRSLMFQTAALAEAGKSFTQASAHSKKFANHAAHSGMSWAMRAMGATGTRRTSDLARQFGHAQLLFNTDGTPEIMNIVIGRSLQALCK